MRFSLRRGILKKIPEEEGKAGTCGIWNTGIITKKGVDRIPKNAFFTCTGSRHRAEGRPCEDHGAAAVRGDVTAAVLCDGAGTKSGGAEAARVTAGLLAEVLCGRFEELYHSDSGTARLTVARLVTDALLAESRSAGIRKEELGCTILAAAMDSRGRAVCFHLGDGIILQRDRGAYSVVTGPSRGKVPGSTYLTMNCDLWQHLRYCRWQSGSLERLLLMTDGAADHAAEHRPGGWGFALPAELDLEALGRHLDRLEPEDDYSAAMLMGA